MTEIPTGSAATEPARIVKLRNSHESFGHLVDYLSRIEPFSKYDLGNFAGALRRQLVKGEHFAAIAGNRIVGYCGWLPTSHAVAEAWAEDEGRLLPVPDGEADAIAITVFTGSDRKLVAALARRTREENPNRRAFFKRDYGTGTARKASVPT